MKRLALLSALLLALLYAAVRAQSTVAFVNGQIITLDVASRVAQAMLVKNGRISDLGSDQAISDKITAFTKVIDLQGQTVMPGFVDAHSHFPASGISSVSIDLAPPPVGNTSSIQSLLEKIAIAANSAKDTEWLLGFNYDNTVLNGGAHPTRLQLDSVAPDHPVYLWHSSGHMGVANSHALSLLSITEDAVSPEGGVIGRDSQTGLLNGLLQESAAPPLATIVRKFSLSRQFRVLTEARSTYLANGVTTLQNGYAGLAMMRLLRIASWVGLVPQRVIVWPAHAKINNEKSVIKKNLNKDNDRSDFKYKVGAIKILVDGSPQGMTAFLSEPYFRNIDNPASYRGFPLLDQAALTEIVSHYHVKGYQLALHGNGDAAIDLIINAVDAAQRKHPRADARHIIVHAQTIRHDQLTKLNKLGLTPSFFVSHTYFWGDWHRQKSLGPSRAANISPAGWANELGMRYSFHTDAPVTPMNPMQLIWSAVNRKTISGFELGPHQRVDIDTALRATTIDAAWQNHVDEDVGSLEVGKFADMVILSQDPYTTLDVRKIQIRATYIAGVEHYAYTDEAKSD